VDGVAFVTYTKYSCCCRSLTLFGHQNHGGTGSGFEVGNLVIQFDGEVGGTRGLGSWDGIRWSAGFSTVRADRPWSRPQTDSHKLGPVKEGHPPLIGGPLSMAMFFIGAHHIYESLT
jgi:hypothetical protein